MKRLFLVLISALICAVAIFSQVADKGILAKLKDVEFNTKKNPDGTTNIEASFIFVGRPSTYFHTIQESPLRLVLEFYDAKLDNFEMPKMEGGPVTGSQVEETLEDMTKMEGLKAEIRKLVRITVFLKERFQYDVSDDFNVINLTGRWVPADMLAAAERQKKKKWLAPTIAGSSVLGVTGIVALILWLTSEPDTTIIDSIAWDPTPPIRTNIQ